MKVLLGQLSPQFDVNKNANRLIKILKRYDADLYVFPELYLTGYLIRDEVIRMALKIDDDIIKKIVKNAGDKIVIFGFPERDNFLYNSAAVVADGEIHVVRKLHLPNFGPFEEKLYFKEGNKPEVISTTLGKIGVQICYDIFFPEVAKSQAMEGADIIINISASPITSRHLFEKIIPARAVENTVFFIYVNWAGTMRTLVFWGGSQVYSPLGKLLHRAPYFEEKVDVLNIDMNEVSLARRLRPTLRDTRLFIV